MIDKMLSFIAPHLCFSCAKIGAILCDRCIQNIVSNARQDKRGSSSSNFTSSVTWVVATRQAELKRVIDAYKFERVMAAQYCMARLLDAGLPELPANTQVIPIPTVAGHVRGRGYDHCALMARNFARRRNLRYTPLLSRRHSLQQRGASRQERDAQAAQAFILHGKIASSTPYLIVDDITTTGATLKWAAQVIEDAGATTVWTAAVARQPLDD